MFESYRFLFDVFHFADWVPTWLLVVIVTVNLALLLACAYIDLKKMILPNVIVFPAIGLALLTLFIWENPLTHIITAVSLGVIFGVLAQIKLRGKPLVGLGDAKLLIWLGLLLGLAVLPAIFIAGIIGLYHFWALSWSKDMKHQHIPHGPHLIAGAIIVSIICALVSGYYI